MTAVVLGEDAPEGGWGEGDVDCAIAAAAESKNIMKGNSSFIALISIQFDLAVGLAQLNALGLWRCPKRLTSWACS